MSKGTKEARSRRTSRQRDRRERKEKSVKLAWEKARNRPAAADKLLDYFAHQIKPIASLAGHPDLVPKIKSSEELTRFAKIVSEQAPKIIDRHSVLWSIAMLPHVRPIEDWIPKGKGANTQFLSLIDHVLVQYRMPRFFYGLFEEAHRKHRRPHYIGPDGQQRLLDEFQDIYLWTRIAQGESLYKLIKSGEWPVPLTKRMCHMLMNLKGKFGLVEAVRRVQVEAFGGDLRLWGALRNSPLGLRFHDFEEPFRATVIQWFCNQSMVDPELVGPLLDYILHLRREGGDEFAMKGRSLLALMRGMERWHHELAHSQKINGTVFNRSGYEPGMWEKKEKLPGGATQTHLWTMTEIQSSKALAAEGRQMRHCVYSYGHSIESGKTSIWSLCRDDDRMLTVEVSNTHEAIVQARGHSNRLPTKVEANYLRLWARENCLEIRRRIL